ncbi:VOC family protein [uncultured Amnibacterium sp.]|uniref:VOC family protein n=1 Tax=uncultured Amnibacterium sp. TaxID=1631851 RepID=UPI0035CC3213
MAAIDHVGLSVGDLDAQLAWYAAAFGWRVAAPFAIPPLGLRGAFVVSEDGQAIELLERQGSGGGLRAPDPQAALLTRGLGHVCVRVDDTDAWHARLLAAGAEERLPPGDAPEPGVRFSFVADPEGNLVELLDRPGPVRSTPRPHIRPTEKEES